MDKIKISFTQFIDFTLKQDASRVNYVKKLKYQPEYHPAFDYWKILRDELKAMLESSYPIDYLVDLPVRVEQRKRDNYSKAIKSFVNFYKKNSLEWFDAGNSYWSFNDLFVRSTPEAGLKINGNPTLVKFYFKGGSQNISEKLNARNVKISLALMRDSTYEKGTQNRSIGIIDIIKNRVHTPENLPEDILLSLKANAHQFIYLWKNV